VYKILSHASRTQKQVSHKKEYVVIIVDFSFLEFPVYFYKVLNIDIFNCTFSQLIETVFANVLE